jgi:hypothetical protein
MGGIVLISLKRTPHSPEKTLLFTTFIAVAVEAPVAVGFPYSSSWDQAAVSLLELAVRAIF